MLRSFHGVLQRSKKNWESVVDLCSGDVSRYTAAFTPLYRRWFSPKPTYREYFGFWLNRHRIFYQRAYAVFHGAATALGALAPGLDYYLAIADSEGEAKIMKAQADAARRASRDSG